LLGKYQPQEKHIQGRNTEGQFFSEEQTKNTWINWTNSNLSPMKQWQNNIQGKVAVSAGDKIRYTTDLAGDPLKACHAVVSKTR